MNRSIEGKLAIHARLMNTALMPIRAVRHDCWAEHAMSVHRCSFIPMARFWMPIIINGFRAKSMHAALEPQNQLTYMLADQHQIEKGSCMFIPESLAEMS